MKKYIKPEMKVQLIELENCILAGSTSVGIVDPPATGPANSKGLNIFGDEENGDSKSIWD
ncbi:MAG: toxin PIN [Prevotella sp.]